jgi:hypothetical protein
MCSGCAFGGSVKNEGTLSQGIRSNTVADLKGIDHVSNPIPNVYNIKAARSASVVVNVPTPAIQRVDQRINRSVDDKVRASSDASWSITEVDGFYYLLIGVAIFIVLMGWIAFANFSRSGNAIDSLGGTIGERIAKANFGTPEWHALDDLGKEVSYYRNKVKKFWPW